MTFELFPKKSFLFLRMFEKMPFRVSLIVLNSKGTKLPELNFVLQLWTISSLISSEVVFYRFRNFSATHCCYPGLIFIHPRHLVVICCQANARGSVPSQQSLIYCYCSSHARGIINSDLQYRNKFGKGLFNFKSGSMNTISMHLDYVLLGNFALLCSLL